MRKEGGAGERVRKNPVAESKWPRSRRGVAVASSECCVSWEGPRVVIGVASGADRLRFIEGGKLLHRGTGENESVTKNPDNVERSCAIGDRQGNR